MIRALYCGSLRHPWLLLTSQPGERVALRAVEAVETLADVLQGGGVDVVLVDASNDAVMRALVGAQLKLGPAALVLVVDDADVGAALTLGDAVGAGEVMRAGASLLELEWALHKALRTAGAARRPVALTPPPGSRELTRRAVLERALRRDLARADAPFTLHFQPRLELRTGQVVGAEALLRYTPDELPTAQPSEVVAMLEELGEIEAVGEWVLHEACRVSAAWERAGHPLVVGVNVSAHQVALGRLDRCVDSALASAGASPELLELELTEGVLIENTADARVLLASLRGRGVRVAIDDFGTGYASLRYVKHFPMDAIKIDREFVRGLPDNVENVAITSAIVALAHRLGIEVVAEGVEDPAEEAFLRELGCDYVQGYLRARPMPADQMLPFVSRRPAAVSQVNLVCVEVGAGELCVVPKRA